jgi:hypothetical protein
MSLCASCGTDLSIGCDHFQSTDFAGQQEKVIEISEAAAGKTKIVPKSSPAFVAGSSDKVDIYVPGKREFTAAPKAGESRGPSVVIGARGPAGPEGKIGPEGKPGKDADIQEAIDAAAQTMEQRIADFESGVQAFIRRELQLAGALDANGKAILIAGPPGRDGASIKGDRGSDGLSIKGDRGSDGLSIKGDRGTDGHDGKDASIEEATKASKDYVMKAIADLVTLDLDRMITNALIARNVLDANGKAIPGPEGKQGMPGVRGGAGSIDAALVNCTKLIEEKFAEFRKEIGR